MHVFPGALRYELTDRLNAKVSGIYSSLGTNSEDENFFVTFVG